MSCRSSYQCHAPLHVRCCQLNEHINESITIINPPSANPYVRLDLHLDHSPQLSVNLHLSPRRHTAARSPGARRIIHSHPSRPHHPGRNWIMAGRAPAPLNFAAQSITCPPTSVHASVPAVAPHLPTQPFASHFPRPRRTARLRRLPVSPHESVPHAIYPAPVRLEGGLYCLEPSTARAVV